MSEKNVPLDQKVQQSLQVLQMSNAQLSEYLAGKMMENPMIEMENLSPDDSKSRLFQRKFAWLERQEEKEQENTVFYAKSLREPSRKKMVYPNETLSQSLIAQLKGLALEPAMMNMAAQIVDSMDDDGYITRTKEELLEQMSLPEDMVEAALDVVQSLIPRGVGAFNLSQCLRLQLQDGLEYRLARAILSKHLNQLQEGRLREIAIEEQVPTDDVEKACRTIAELNPRPGSAFNREDLPFYITPDVLVTKFADCYEVMLCEFNTPQIRISQEYVDMARRSQDPALIEYIKENTAKAKWLNQCVETRGATLLKVTRAIMRRQEQFLKYGPQYLNMITVKAIARDLGMQDKTVHRTIKNKYLQCPYGVYPLAYFLQEDGNTQQHINIFKVKKAMEDIFAAEREEAPYTDQKISQILWSRGFNVNVRTVEKYREQMGLPDANGRLNLNCGQEEDCGCEDCSHNHSHH